MREVERLLVDAIAAARQTIYLENQYFTAHAVGDALAKRLGEDDGPEIVVILPQRTVGWSDVKPNKSSDPPRSCELYPDNAPLAALTR